MALNMDVLREVLAEGIRLTAILVVEKIEKEN